MRLMSAPVIGKDPEIFITYWELHDKHELRGRV